MSLRRMLLLLLLAWGCTEEVITKEVVVEKSWTQKSGFDYLAKIKINSLSTGENLYVYGPQNFSTITSKNEILHFATRLKYPSFYHLPISKDYFVETDKEWIRFANSKSPVWDEGSFWIDLKKLTPDFLGISFAISYQSSTIDINSHGQCLVPILSSNPGQDLVSYMFNIVLEDNLFVTIADTIRVSIPNPTSLNPNGQIYCLKALADYFILSAEGGTFKIYSDGRHKKVIDKSIFNVFRHGSKIFAVKQFGQIFISEDEGETWQTFQDYPDGLVLANYFNVGDSLIATSRSAVYSIRLDGNRYTARPLANDGLETNEITSISQFRDSIYVSTYSGLFYKPVNKFFEGKKKE